MNAPHDVSSLPPIAPLEADELHRLRATPEAPARPDEPIAALLLAARRFHRLDPGAGETLASPGDDLLPVLLHAMRDPGRIRHDYPLFLLPPGTVEDAHLGVPLSELLSELVSTVVPEPGDARILLDNLGRLEVEARARLTDASSPAAEVLESAGQAMEEGLALAPGAGAILRDHLGKLLEAVPPGGVLVPLSERTPLILCIHAARHRAGARRAALRADAQRLHHAMRDLLRIERAKGEGDFRGDTLGGGGAYLDTEMLAGVLQPPLDRTPADTGRRELIERVAATLERFLAEDDRVDVAVLAAIDESESPAGDGVVWRRTEAGGVCRAAGAWFDEQAAGYVELFGAMRAARLLEALVFEPERHGAMLETFSPSSFSRDEFLSLPPVVALESAEHLASVGMMELSRLLRSGRPVHVLVSVQPAGDPGDPGALGGDLATHHRFELAYLGIAHREATVHQSSAARPVDLLRGFLSGLDATTPALHVVSDGLTADGAAPRLGAWMHAGAALEGRAHPFLHYAPEAGQTWARRFDLAGNPQPEADWPVYELTGAATETGDQEAEPVPIAFTFADYALLEPAFRRHFRVIPPEVIADDLVPVDAYLALSPDEAETRLPFVWAADEHARVHRLLISWRLASACRDRLDYWRTIQELAGIRNEHVREAVERERERIEAEAIEQRQKLAAEHAATVEQVRRHTAGEALRRLAETLLGTDVTALGSALAGSGAGSGGGSGPSTAAPVAAASAVPAAGPETTDAAPTSAPGADAAPPAPAPIAEAWIDTPLCTSCNDCLDINKQMFAYNGNKQAVIADPRAGPYRHLVEAAEKCPAACIHPGLPLDPDEPDLEEIKRRAEPFN